MATQLFDTIPWPGASYEDEDTGTELLTEDGPCEERAIKTMPLLRRVYSWPRGEKGEQATRLQAFMAARTLRYEAFYVLDPWQSQRWNVSVGPGDAAALTFSLPLTLDRDEYRGFPVQGTVFARVGGVSRAVASVDTDARTVTLSGAPPGAGVTVHLDYQEMRLCRFGPSVRWDAEDHDWYKAEFAIREVFRSL